MTIVVATTDDGGADHRHGDAEENCDLAGAVDARRLEDVGRDALERGREDDHAEAGPHPDVDGDEQEIVAGAVDEPRLGLARRTR